MKLNRKAVSGAIAIIGVLAVVGVLWMIKNANRDAFKNESPGLSPAKAVPGIAKGPLKLTSSFDLDAFRSSGLPLIIDFGADSCIPCKEMAPVLAELHTSLEGKAIIRFVDVWKYRDLASGYPIQVIPTQIFFDSEGKPFTPDMSAMQIPFTRYKTRDTDEHVFTTHEGGLDKDQMLSILTAMGMKQ